MIYSVDEIRRMILGVNPEMRTYDVEAVDYNLSNKEWYIKIDCVNHILVRWPEALHITCVSPIGLKIGVYAIEI